MSETEQALRAHYSQGGLETALLAALTKAGKDVEKLSPADLMGADEFHVGGAQATKALTEQLALRPDMHLLDLGSGLGGPARHIARAHGCRVTGIDLTEEYVQVANSLTARMGLADMVDFRLASANRLDFPDATFDGITMMHVGMNVPDKAPMFAALRRALRPGGFFAIYDIMQVGPGDLVFPLPWSSQPATSFVETPATYRALLEQAGFQITAERNRGPFAVEFFATMRARIAQSGPPPIGLNMAMGATAPAKIGNLQSLIAAGVLAPVELIAVSPS